MMVTMIKKIFFFSFILCSSLTAQIDDFGTWWGIDVRKSFAKDFRVGVETEIRLNENSMSVRNFYVEPYFRYAPLNWLSFTFQYRLDSRYRRQDDYFYFRQRPTLDIGFEYKLKRFTFGYRNRTQLQWADFFDQDIFYPEVYNRNQISIEYKLPNLPFYISTAGELWIPLQLNSNIDNFRSTSTFSYKINNHHRIDVRFIYQTELNTNNPTRDYILSTKYILSL